MNIVETIYARSSHRQCSVEKALRMQEIRIPNPPVVTGIYLDFN